MIDEYIEYSVLLIVVSIFSIIWGLYFVRKNEKALKEKIHTGENVTVFRRINGENGMKTIYLYLKNRKYNVNRKSKY